MESVVSYPHIVPDKEGVPYIAGSRVSVAVIAFYHTRDNMNAQALAEGFPLLSMAEIYAALGYYYDNQEEIENQLLREEEEYQELQRNIDTQGMTNVSVYRQAV